MALRVVMNRTKSWGTRGCWVYQLVKGKFGSVGAVRGDKSFVGLFNFNTRPLHLSFNQSCRHYFLPPPPPVMINGGSFYEDEGGVCTVVNLKPASRAARFAVWTYNETQGRNIRFERVVRASEMQHSGIEYYITLEGIDENGDLNVYYTEVLHFPCKQEMELIKFQPVDESFSYPFEETRYFFWVVLKQ